MITFERKGKSVSGGLLWHVFRNGSFVGHVVSICDGDLYACHNDLANPGNYELCVVWPDVSAFF
jgi:hypothetical protein